MTKPGLTIGVDVEDNKKMKFKDYYHFLTPVIFLRKMFGYKGVAFKLAAMAIILLIMIFLLWDLLEVKEPSKVKEVMACLIKGKPPLDVFATVIQLTIVIVAIWYAWETRRMRVQDNVNFKTTLELQEKRHNRAISPIPAPKWFILDLEGSFDISVMNYSPTSPALHVTFAVYYGEWYSCIAHTKVNIEPLGEVKVMLQMEGESDPIRDACRHGYEFHVVDVALGRSLPKLKEDEGVLVIHFEDHEGNSHLSMHGFRVIGSGERIDFLGHYREYLSEHV